MLTLMCRSCGHFVAATETDDGLEPVPESCPECGGDDFEAVGTG